MKSGKEKISVNKNIKAISLVKSLAASLGDNPGEIDLQWDAVPGSISYVVQYHRKGGIKNSDPAQWKHIDIVTESCCTITGLKRGGSFAFRVAVIIDKGQSKWSREVNKSLETSN